MDVQQKIHEMIGNEDFVEGLLNAETPEQLGKVLTANHITLEGASLEDAFNEVQKQVTKAEEGELDDEALKAVSGGGAIWSTLVAGVKMSVASGAAASWASVVLPVIGVVAVFGIAKYGYDKYRRRSK